MLQVTVDGLSTDNPVPVFATIHPIHLGDPVKIINTAEPPRGIAINSAGNILISTRTAVVAVDKDGSLLHSIAASAHYDLFGIAIDQDDNIYVSDSAQARLLKLNSCGKTIKTYASGLLLPRGVTVHNDEVLLCDSGNGRVLVLMRELIMTREIGMGNLRWPSEVVVDGQKTYICDHQNNQIIIYTRNMTREYQNCR